ncbi:CPBP family intramembrane metalloprotease [Rhodococcus hoagii]|nr:CPBP family intramembrane metalloprotease [Prescottella equi]
MPFVREHVTEISPLKALGVWVAITSSAIEEIIFRRMVMDALADNGIGAVGQIGASALAFGVAHGAWVLLGREWAIAIPVVVSTTCLGQDWRPYICYRIAHSYLPSSRISRSIW